MRRRSGTATLQQLLAVRAPLPVLVVALAAVALIVEYNCSGRSQQVLRPKQRLQGTGGGGKAVENGHFKPKHPLWWHAPVWQGSGYATEAANFILSMVRSGLVSPEDVWVSNHGHGRPQHVIDSMDKNDRADLEAAEARPKQPSARNRSAIVVCHSMPGFFEMPKASGRDGERCPPNREEHPWSYVVGRTMYETDRVDADFAMRSNTMDEIWVPSQWQYESFAASGVNPRIMRVVPEGVNTTRFDPDHHEPFEDLSARAQIVFGTRWAEKLAAGRRRNKKPFRFISSFKWEGRKGWDVLLEAYLSEFKPSDDVELIILTKPWHQSKEGYAHDMVKWAKEHVDLSSLEPAPGQADAIGPQPRAQRQQDRDSGDGRRRLLGARRRLAVSERRGPPGPAAGQPGAAGGAGGAWQRREMLARRLHQQDKGGADLDPRRLPSLFVLDSHFTDEEFPRFYSSADAFVLPSRGEGWGRPLVEAMSMGLPLIATNWSGMTAFLDDKVGYPIAVEKLVPVSGDLKWAQPSVAHLKRLMRRVVSDPAEAKAKGAAARERMVELYSPAAIAEVLLREWRRIEEKLAWEAAAAAAGP